MIRIVSRCPYCDRGTVAMDDSILPRIVFDHHGVDGAPCRHVAFIIAVLAFYPRSAEDPSDVSWFWVHGEGFHPSEPSTALPLFEAYVLGLASGDWQEEEPKEKYESVSQIIEDNLASGWSSHGRKRTCLWPARAAVSLCVATMSRRWSLFAEPCEVCSGGAL